MTGSRRSSGGTRRHYALSIACRISEKVGLRPDHLTSIEKRYREIPALGCVGISIKRPDRYSIAVRDVRIGHRKIAAPRWEGGTELGAVLFANTIDITRDTARIHCKVIASLGSHAIGRRLQRGFDNRETAIIADLVALAAAAPGLIAQGGGEFEVPVPSGRWVGAVARFEDLPSGGSGLAANVRTFKS